MSTKAKTRTTKTVNSKTTKKAVAKKVTTNQSTKPLNKNVEIKKEVSNKPLDKNIMKESLTTTLIELKNHHHEIGWLYFELDDQELVTKANLEADILTRAVAKDVLFENALEGDKIIADNELEYKIRYYVDNLTADRRFYKDTL